MGLVQLITTVESREEALALARAAVDEHAAACVQVIGPITSVYRWEGEVRETAEFLLLLKTSSEGLERLTAYVRDRHPYDTPELTAVESLFADERYLAWSRAQTTT